VQRGGSAEADPRGVIAAVVETHAARARPNIFEYLMSVFLLSGQRAVARDL
jgi:hypothetical protein